MSGHSKWATIKHKKGAADAKRGTVLLSPSAATIIGTWAAGSLCSSPIEELKRRS